MYFEHLVDLEDLVHCNYLVIGVSTLGLVEEVAEVLGFLVRLEFLEAVVPKIEIDLEEVSGVVVGVFG
jgi:hypothetical protein